MTDDQNTDKPRVGLIKRCWRAFSTPSAKFSAGLLLIVGFGGGIIFWGGYHWAMEATNTEAFCMSCHEMADTVGVEWKKSPHYENEAGVRVICSDCHVPKEWQYKVVRKIQATSDLYHTIMGTSNTPEKFEARRLHMARNVWRDMKSTNSRECRNCHSFTAMDLRKQKKTARAKHERAMEEGGTCIDCHKGIAHELPDGWDEEEQS